MDSGSIHSHFLTVSSPIISFKIKKKTNLSFHVIQDNRDLFSFLFWKFVARARCEEVVMYVLTIFTKLLNSFFYTCSYQASV